MNVHKYYVPEGSKWPILMAFSIFIFLLGFVLLLHDVSSLVMPLGLIGIIYIMFRWFKVVVNESLANRFKIQEDSTFRMAMGWFIFSEVTFFSAFFGTLFYLRVFSIPWLGGDGSGLLTNQFLWPAFSTNWPLISFPAEKTLLNAGSVIFSTPTKSVSAWGIPALNTLILLTSGITVTLAHYALIVGKRKELMLQLALTILLGLTFLGFQIYEYSSAYSEGLTLKTGAYGSIFYILTGFHGFHVFVGITMLSCIWLRIRKGHFTADNHFAFLAATWYWHFVDVVWLGLFLVVYWL